MAEIDLTQKFPRLTPIRSTPPLMRLNGCGTGLYGRRDYDPETGTYVSTLCVALLFIPVLCLRAYRVASGQRGGWYFLGREPLSGVAKSWNVLLLLAIATTVGLFQYDAHTHTPGYRARQTMALARKHEQNGHLAEAAKNYRDLSVAGAEESGNATAALRALLDGACQTAPLGESAGVYAAAAQVARRGDAIPASEVADKGLKLVADKGDADPRHGLELLDAVRPLVSDTRAVDARRLELLRKWSAAEPDNLEEVVYPLASLLEQQGKLDEAKKLLLPHKSQLGQGEGARVLGIILGREGDYDGAYALLWPYVKSRLDNFHVAEQALEDAEKRVQDREVQLLRDDKAPADFKERYEAAGTDQRRAMVQEYINNKVKQDPDFARAQEALEREASVVPVALELGIVMLQRAQGQADPANRKSQLESAEQVFLAVGGVAGESDVYRLSLGQVDYWLGKQADGHKLFDEYLASKNRGADALLAVANRLREVGAVPEARSLAEEAYDKATDTDDKHQAASFRAVCFKDSDDRIAWLRKSDTASPSVKADLAKALGDQAMEQGRDDDAAAQYRAALDALSALPRGAAALNETALAYAGLFQATGDRKALDRCADFFQQAVDLQPSDPILLFNAGTTLLDVAMTDVIGADIDLRALRESGDLSMFGYLYRDQAGRDAVVKKLKDHPAIARALSYLDKVTVLSPRNANAFGAVAAVHQFTHDEPALRALAQRLRATELDTSDALARHKEMIDGSKDQQTLAKLNAAITRAEAQVAALRPRGGRTAAVAVGQLAAGLMALDLYGGTVDADRVVALAEEANRMSDSSATSSLVSTAYLYRAAKNLGRNDPAFDAFSHKYARSLGPTYLVAAAAGESDELRRKIAAHPDVRKAVERVRQSESLFSESGSADEWALLKVIDPAAAEKVADEFRRVPRKTLVHEIDRTLNPASGAEAMEAYWLSQMRGKPEEGREALRKVAALGVPVPGAGE